ncbi:nitroreductase family deazaflavin-dependent oxidoreductase [Streptomyces sp. NPDC059568]|uniref:nitroreductase family deazaflavin-dependent oxidoreductase n=1 Tax=Streptomyces sp. NPDC059568 TaxID=3346868 RepID=UPI0036988222
MEADMEYEPSPSERVREQVARYEATGGREGGTLEGRPVVILTSRGAKSGKVRKTPLIRIEQDGVYAVTASAAGSPTHPAWYWNVLADPQVRLQDGDQVREFRAREPAGEELDRWWAVAEAHWPHFPEYRERAGGRVIPLLLLEPADLR